MNGKLAEFCHSLWVVGARAYMYHCTVINFIGLVKFEVVCFIDRYAIFGGVCVQCLKVPFTFTYKVYMYIYLCSDVYVEASTTVAVIPK